MTLCLQASYWSWLFPLFPHSQRSFCHQEWLQSVQSCLQQGVNLSSPQPLLQVEGQRELKAPGGEKQSKNLAGLMPGTAESSLQGREQVKYSFQQTSRMFLDAEERTQIQAQAALLSPPSLISRVWRDDKHL